MTSRSLAYGVAAVPETLGQSGSIFTNKSDAISTARTAYALVNDEVVRRNVISSQQLRRVSFLPDQTTEKLEDVISCVLAGKAKPKQGAQLPLKPHEVQSIAVVKLDHIGDLLLASPVFTSLRRKFPNAKLTAVVAPGSAEVLRNHPDVDDCIKFDAPWFWREIPSGEILQQKLAQNSAALHILTAMQFDLVINLRSDLTNLPFAASLPHKYLLSYTNDSSFPFLASHSITRTRGMHTCDQHKALLSEIGAMEWSPPKMHPMTSDYDASRFLLPRGGACVALFAGAGIPLKRWSEAKFKELARRLCRQGLLVVIVGSAADHKIGQGIAEFSGAENLCGKLTLLELSAFLEQCNVLVTNDSAPMHIGAAAGTSVVYITRPNTAEEFAPVGDRHVKCCAAVCLRPCEGFDPDKRDALSEFCSCIQGISVDEVENKVMTIIGTYSIVQANA